VARSLVVFGLAFAGIALLAGVGWALVAGACLALVLWPQGVADDRLAGLARRAAVVGRQWAAQVRSAPRRATAVTGMAGGVVLVPAGLGVATGLGVAVAAAGGLLIGVGLLTGWGA
jgi:hypothetical protein